MSKTRKTLNKLLDEFLKKKSKSDGRYAKISQEDMDCLYEILYTLRELKCEKDSDGDIPLEFRVIDRNTHESSNFFATRYTHTLHSAEERKRELSLRLANLNMATHSIEQLIRSEE